MAMIKIENLTFSYPGSFDNIFENVSFHIDTDWRLGFAGRNGRGKTTFLSLLPGKYEYSGKIISPVNFGYFPYEVKDESLLTGEILGEICPQAAEWEFMRELSLLAAEADILWRPFETLSKGEQTKALLAALFLGENRFLLIDEPTNHLDIAAREKVAEYLKKKKGFILVSHDRRFLDICTDHTLSINKTDIEVQSGNFSVWFEGFNRKQEYEQGKSEKLQKEVKQLRKAAERTAQWSAKAEKGKYGGSRDFVDRGFIGHRAAKMMKRSKAAEARQLRAADEKSKLLKNTETAESLKIFPREFYADTLVAFSDVQIFYGDKKVCGPLSFTLGKGERIALDGRNGSGKSSLLKLLKGENIEHSGSVSKGSGLIISYISQDTSSLSGSLRDYAEENGIDESLFKAILRKMDFDRVQFEKDMRDFSGGQKKKVLIARSLCEKAHLYVWDEPLNFIDIYSRIQIEELIKDFSPTMIFVEHDKAFRENVATRVVTVG